MNMGTQVTGRKRIPNREKLTAEDDALNQIAREAEARLAAKRAARAEAREIRMKELERQQKEIYQAQKKYYGLDSKWGHIEQWMEDSERYSRHTRRHTSISDDEERMSVGSRGSLRGTYSSDLYCSTSSLPSLRRHNSTQNGRPSMLYSDGPRSQSHRGSVCDEAVFTSSRRFSGSSTRGPSDYSGFLGSSSRASSRASSARASPVVEERPDRDFVDKGSRTASTLSAATLASLGGPTSRRGSCDTSFSVETEASIREIKDSLAESEEKYRKAMVSNAQLHNEKSNLMYQVDTLKEAMVELEEQLWEARREYDDRTKEFERERHAHSVLQFQFKEMRETLKQSDELLTEVGQLRLKRDSCSREISDLQETLEWKEKKIGALERQREFWDIVRMERDKHRDEVVLLRDALKKHGIVVSPEVTTNGETGQGEIDEYHGTDSDSRLAQEAPHTGGESMLGKAKEDLRHVPGKTAEGSRLPQMSIAYDPQTTKRSKSQSNFSINEQSRACASKLIKATEKRSLRKDRTGKHPTRKEGIRKQTRDEGTRKIPVTLDGMEHSPDENEATEKRPTRNERSGIPRIRNEGTTKLPIRTERPPTRKEGTHHTSVLSNGYKPGKDSEDEQPEFCVEETKSYAPSCQGAIAIDMELSNHSRNNEEQVHPGGTQNPYQDEYLSQPVKSDIDGKWDEAYAPASGASGGRCVEEVPKHSGLVTPRSANDVIFHNKAVVLCSVASVEENFQTEQKEREHLTGTQENESTLCDKVVVLNSGATTDQSLQNEEDGTKHLTAKAIKETISDNMGAVPVIRALCEKQQKSKELVRPVLVKDVSFDDKANVPVSVVTVRESLASDLKNTKHLTAMSEKASILDKKTIMLDCETAGVQALQHEQEKREHLSTVAEKEVIFSENTFVPSSRADGEPSLQNEGKNAENVTAISSEETTCGDKLVLPVVRASGGQALDEEQESTALVTPRPENEVTFDDKCNVAERKTHENEQENTWHLTAMSEERAFLDAKAAVTEYETFCDQSPGNDDVIGDELAGIDCGGSSRKIFENEQKSIKRLTDMIKNTAMTRSDEMTPEKSVENTKAVESKDQMICICEEDVDCGGSDRRSFENEQKSVLTVGAEKNTTMTQNDEMMPENSVEITKAVESKDQMICEYEEESRTGPAQILVEPQRDPEESQMNPLELQEMVDQAKTPTSSTGSSFVSDQPWNDWNGLDQIIQSMIRGFQLLQESLRDPATVEQRTPGNPLMANSAVTKDSKVSTPDKEVSPVPTKEVGVQTERVSQDSFGSSDIVRLKVLDQKAKTDQEMTENTLGVASITRDSKAKVKSSLAERLGACSLEVTEYVSAEKDGHDNPQPRNDLLTGNNADLDFAASHCDESNMTKSIGSTPDKVLLDVSTNPKKDRRDSALGCQAKTSNAVMADTPKPIGRSVPDLLKILPGAQGHLEIVPVDTRIGRDQVLKMRSQGVAERPRNFRNCAEMTADKVEEVLNPEWVVVDLPVCSRREERIQEEQQRAVDLSTVQLASPKNKPGEQPSDYEIDSCEEANSLAEEEAMSDQEELPTVEVVVGKVQSPKGKHKEDCKIS